MPSEMKIGWDEVDITPDRKVELCGQYYQRVSRGVHSRLKAVAWAVKQGDQVSIMVGLDVAMVAPGFQQALRNRLRDRVPFDPKNVFLNAIHTHNAPSAVSFKDWWPREPDAVSADEYRDLLLERLEAVDPAPPAGDATPVGKALARLGCTKTRPRAGGARRVWCWERPDRPDLADSDGSEA